LLLRSAEIKLLLSDLCFFLNTFLINISRCWY